MNYNDNKICNDRECQNINNNFSSINALEVQDLQEILHKLREQKEALIRNNLDGKLDNIIATTSDNLSTLTNIIKRRNLGVNSNSTVACSLSKILQLSEPDVYGKYPSHDEIMRMRELENTPEIPNIENDSTIPNLDNGSAVPPLSPSPNEGREVRVNRRGFPMQGSLLDRLTKMFKVNKKETHSSHIQNRFHNICDDQPYNHHAWDKPHHFHDDCDPKNKLVTNQIDLLRLLILYITLRPNCRDIRKICSITSNQLDVLLEII